MAVWGRELGAEIYILVDYYYWPEFFGVLATGQGYLSICPPSFSNIYRVIVFTNFIQFFYKFFVSASATRKATRKAKVSRYYENDCLQKFLLLLMTLLTAKFVKNKFAKFI